MKKLSYRLEKLSREAFYARVNWSAHLVPKARIAANEFATEQLVLGHPKIHFSVLSEQARGGIDFKGEENIWTDSICFSYGQELLRATPIIRVTEKYPTLIEERARFVMAQFLSGHVVAMIYPPESEILKCKKAAYVVAAWSDPNMIMGAKIKKLLRLTTETNFYCASDTFPNSRGQRVLAKLEAKDKIYNNGGSRFWVWVRYAFSFSKSALRAYGVGIPKQGS